MHAVTIRCLLFFPSFSLTELAANATAAAAAACLLLLLLLLLQALGSLAVLPEVVEAVGGRATVIVDGGFSRGTDIVKAIALGADAVAIGRLTGIALAAGGVPGVCSLACPQRLQRARARGIARARACPHA
jgi:hypothetical protein